MIQKIVVAPLIVLLMLTVGFMISPQYTSAQDNNQPVTAVLTFGNRTCTLSTNQADAIAAPSTPALALTDDCLSLMQTLSRLGNGTYWFSLTIPNDTRWLSLSVVEGDLYPPLIDGRGQFFGCQIQNRGLQQTCRILADIDGTSYLVEIPLGENVETSAVISAITVPATPSAPPVNPPGLTLDQQAALDELRTVAAVTVNRDGTLTAIVQLSENSLNHTVDIFAPMAGYTADDLNLDITPDGFTIAANNSFLAGSSGNLIYHMVVVLGNQTTVLRTDWVNFNGTALAADTMQSYDPLINGVVLAQVDGILNKFDMFDYTIDNITLSSTGMELEATFRFR